MIFSYLISIAISIILAAFFSGVETAFTSLNFMKLIHLVEKKDKAAVMVHDILKRPDKLLAAMLIGTNLSVVLASAFSTELVMRFDPIHASFWATLFTVPLVLIFGEIIPKTICQIRPNGISLRVAPWVLLAEKVLSPIVAVISVITTSLLNIISPRAIKKNPFLTKDEIKLILRDISKEGIIEPYEKDVIERIFDWTLTRASDIIVPLKDMIFVEYGQSRQEVLEKSRKSGFTRLVVFEDKKIKGLVNVFDLFYNEEEADWHKFIRSLNSVSFDERLDEVFAKMQPSRETMAAVLKDNLLIGILTVEDLIEEIVYRAKPVK